MAYTYTQLVAPAAQSLADLRKARKSRCYADLVSVGISGVNSWTIGSVPSSMIEMYAWALADYDQAQAFTAQGALVLQAEGDALTARASDTFDCQRAPGTYTVARVLLTDAAGAGPFTFNPASVSVSVGLGGLLYNGVDLGGGSVTVPKSGSAYLYVRSEAVGAAYSQLSLNAINTVARGNLAGVIVANDATWLTFSGAVAGADQEGDAALRTRCVAKWGTLGTGSPPSAYVNWALTAQPTQVTRVGVFTNLSTLDPGRVDLILAGPAGAVGVDVVAAVQAAIAPAQVGGTRIPATARCVVSSASNHAIAVTGTVYIQKEYNTASFQAQVSADFAAYAAAVDIGGGPLGLVSYDRVLEILQYRAALSPGVIYDATITSPTTDVALAYNEVPTFTLNLTYTSV